MRTRDPIFLELPLVQLYEVASYLNFDIPIGTSAYSRLNKEDQLSWLAEHRTELEDHFCQVGSHFLGKTRSYHEIVRATARKIGAKFPIFATTAEIETAIVSHILRNILDQMTDEQRAEVEKL